MKRILITGGKGFIGSWVIRDLLDKGASVVVYDLPNKSFTLPEITESVEVIDGDITNFEQIKPLLKHLKADALIHAAALANVEQAQSQPGETIRINIQGTLNAFEIARNAGIKRVVYTSSRGVFGHIEDRHGHPTYELVDEDYRCRPYTIYGATKFFGECLGLNYARMHGIEFCALRFSMIYGPGKRTTHGSGGFHSVLIEESLVGNPITIARGKDQKDDLIYIRDVAQSIVRAALVSRLSYSVYNVGTGVASTPVDFAQAVKTLVPHAQIYIGPGLDYLDRGYQNYCIFDISRAQRDLGYCPEYNLLEGIQDYIKTLNNTLSTR